MATLKERRAAWYQANKERLKAARDERAKDPAYRELMRQRAQEHRDRHGAVVTAQARKSQKKIRAEARDEINAVRRIKRLANHEKALEYERAYRAANRDKIAERKRRYAAAARIRWGEQILRGTVLDDEMCSAAIRIAEAHPEGEQT